MTAAEIAHALAQRIESLCVDLLPRGRKIGSTWRVGSLAGESGQSLAVFWRSPKAGNWCDFTTSEFGDALDLVANVHGIPINQAMRWSREWLGRADATTFASYKDNYRPLLAQEGDAARLKKARHLWSKRLPVLETPAERYIRHVRGYQGPLPGTLGYLPPTNRYSAALVAAFGLPDEPELGRLSLSKDAIRGVHLTRLLPDGSGKAIAEPIKLTIGPSLGSPIVVAPPNDGLGLAITEGIEDALSVHAVTGLGAWAAGGAGRMSALADVVPGCIETVTIYRHSDEAGLRGADSLARGLDVRGIEVFLTTHRKQS